MTNTTRAPDQSALEQLIDELREQWAASIAGGHQARHRDGSNDPLRITLIVAHTAHVHRLAEAIKSLVGHGLAFEAISLVREAFETAITVSWVAQNPVAAQSLVNDYINKRRALRDEFAQSASAVFREGAAGVMIQEHLQQPTVHDEQAKRFKTLCGDFEPKGNDLYVLYRWLSGYSHPGVKVADRYVKPDSARSGSIQLTARDDEGPTPELLLHLTAVAMVWSGSAANFLTPNPIRRDWLRSVARDLGSPAYLELTPEAQQKIDKSVRATKRKAKRKHA